MKSDRITGGSRFSGAPINSSGAASLKPKPQPLFKSSSTPTMSYPSSYLPISRRHLSYLFHSDKVTLRLSSRPELRLQSKKSCYEEDFARV
ncbi:hypothetical protein CASFOL_032079 [Castilleja foliolosa]|uniref:Uncharacterized protein n=1 Tax=Castilleja foliolosa TaxID=1961234 RepID=A0ABD3C0F9_9LAMI